MKGTIDKPLHRTLDHFDDVERERRMRLPIDVMMRFTSTDAYSCYGQIVAEAVENLPENHDEEIFVAFLCGLAMGTKNTVGMMLQDFPYPSDLIHEDAEP